MAAFTRWLADFHSSRAARAVIDTSAAVGDRLLAPCVQHSPPHTHAHYQPPTLQNLQNDHPPKNHQIKAMAGQAQKKAAKAASSNANFYGTFVLVVNAVYLLWLAGQAAQGTCVRACVRVSYWRVDLID